MNQKLQRALDELGQVTGRSVECGWMFDEVAWLLHALVSLVRPHVVIQTGHLWGKSACIVLDALQYRLHLEGNLPQGDGEFDRFVREKLAAHGTAFGMLMSVDPKGMGVPNSESGVAWLTEHYPGQFEYYPMTSKEFFASRSGILKVRLANRDVLGVVDGDHSPEGCMDDLRALADLDAKVIVVDDTTWLPELEKVCQDFAAGSNYQFMNLPFLNGVGLLVRK